MHVSARAASKIMKSRNIAAQSTIRTYTRNADAGDAWGLPGGRGYIPHVRVNYNLHNHTAELYDPTYVVICLRFGSWARGELHRYTARPHGEDGHRTQRLEFYISGYCHKHISSAALAVRRESGEKQSRPRRSARASEDGSAPPG